MPHPNGTHAMRLARAFLGIMTVSLILKKAMAGKKTECPLFPSYQHGGYFAILIKTGVISKHSVYYFVDTSDNHNKYLSINQ